MTPKLLAAAALLAVTAAQAQTGSAGGFQPSASGTRLAGLSDLAADIDFLHRAAGARAGHAGVSGSVLGADAGGGISFSGLSSGIDPIAPMAPTAFAGSYSVSPSTIPELESAAMLLAGLGVVGFITARLRQG